MNGFQYPSLEIDVLSAKTAFQTLLDRPRGINSRPWPPPQAEYLKVYLKEIGCQTMLVENHYIDRVFMHDDAAYYVQSLRSYPNFTKRVHFFRQSFDHADWRAMINRAERGEYSVIQQDLQTGYLGFSVIRPLPDSPIGRTVVLPATSPHVSRVAVPSFATTRRHNVHLAGFSLHVEGVPFQSQDQGVSACATTALWSALDCVAVTEEITVSSPASITESATRYLQEGRTFPNDGLTIHQMCAATRAAGFSPLVIGSESIEKDALQIFSYTRSGFAPVLALLPTKVGESRHAVCCVGVRYEPPPPQTDITYKFREASSGLRGLYIHDDRLGPYAPVELSPLTDKNSRNIHTCVSIEWPDKKPVDSWLLHAIVVPLPQKLRLTLSRLRRIGLYVAHAVGEAFAEPQTTLDCRFQLSRTYTKRIYSFDLSSEGLYRAVCGTVLSRYIGLIEIAGPAGSILDIVVDSTETNSESAVLACIKRSGFPRTQIKVFEAIAKHLGVVGIS